MTSEWSTVKDDPADRIKAAEDMAEQAVHIARNARVRADAATSLAKLTSDRLLSVQARVKVLEDELEVADKTALWGCLLAAVSGGVATGAVILAVIAGVCRWAGIWRYTTGCGRVRCADAGMSK